MIAVCLLLFGTSAPWGDLPSDPRLDRAFAFEARIEPLPEVLARLGKETGATLTVERKMIPLKATVLVAVRPARRTMADLASVFDAEWAPTESGYRLQMSVPKRNLLERYLVADRKSVREATERKWREAAALAKTDWPLIAGLRDEAMKTVSNFRSSTEPGFGEASARFQALEAMARNGSQYLLGRLLMGFSERDWASLWEGRAYYASSIAKDGIPKLPGDSIAISSPQMHREEGEPLYPVRAFFRFDLESGDAGYVVTWNGGAIRANPGTGWGGYSEESSKHPFRLAQDAWATDPQTSKAPELDRPLKKIAKEKSPWEGPWANDSDSLEMLHRQSGLDIVAEATRRASRRAPGPFTEATVRAALNEWSFASGARLENGTLLFRPHAFWSRRATEPTEAAMRRWEARPDRGIDALAELVAALTPAQARMLPAVSSRKRLERIDGGLSGLRVWGLLSPQERARLRAGEGVSVASLGLPAREAALAAMLDGVFEGASLSERMLTLFDAPWNPNALGSLSLWVSTKDVETGSMWLDVARRPERSRSGRRQAGARSGDPPRVRPGSGRRNRLYAPAVRARVRRGMVTTAFLLLIAQNVPGLPSDPRLDRPLAIEARIEQLPDLLARIGKELGTPLTVERRMEGLKATIFTPARPARLTLAGLASVFDAEWMPVKGGGYRLSETVPARNRREAYLALERASVRKSAVALLTGPFVEPVPPPSIFPSQQEKEEDRPAREQGMRDLRAAHENLQRLYRSWSEGERERFWSGEVMAQFRDAQGTEGPALTLLRLRWVAKHIAGVTIRNTGEERFGFALSPLPDPEDERGSKFRLAQEAWWQESARLETPELQIPLGPPSAPTQRWKRGVTDMDVLENIYRRSGLPIIAEADRVQRYGKPTVEGATILDVLQGRNRPSGFARFSDRTLLHRPNVFWKERGREPSEAALAPLEAEEHPTLDTISEAFAAMSDEVVAHLDERVMQHDLSPYVSSLLFLRVWGRLTPAERKTLRAGGRISVTGMRAPVREALRQATVAIVFGDADGGRFIFPYTSKGDPAGEKYWGERLDVHLALMGYRPAAFSMSLGGPEGKTPAIKGVTYTGVGPPMKQGTALEITDAKGKGLWLFISR